jgi:hypothetical protein
MSGKRIGYIRICGKKNENKQLHGVALDIIFTDTNQSKNTEQTQLEAAIHSAAIGDQVFVDSMDRLGTSKMDALRNVTEFTSRGVSVTFLKEGLVFTAHDEPISVLIKTLLLEFNPAKPLSFEKELHPPVATKKVKKETKRRKVTLTSKQVVELKRRASAGENKTALARHYAISRESLLAYLR